MTESPNPRREALEDFAVSQLVQFLDGWYHRMTASKVAKTWEHQKALRSALDLFEINDIPCPDKDYLLQFDDEAMARNIVPTMPEKIMNNFDNISLQLQLVVNELGVVRGSLENDDVESLSQICDEAANKRLVQQAMKRSIIHATEEVALAKRCQSTWIADTEDRMARLAYASQETEHALLELQKIEAVTAEFGPAQNQKSKSCLLNMMSGQDAAKVKTVFSSWSAHYYKYKAEAVYRDQYQKQIDQLKQQLFDFKQKQMESIRKVMAKDQMSSDAGIQKVCFHGWAKFLKDIKAEGIALEEIKAAKARLGDAQSAQAGNAKKTLMRMNAGGDDALVGYMWQAWVQYVVDYRKNKELEDAVEQQEQKMKAYMQTKKDQAKGVLDRMNAASDQGLLLLMVTKWAEHLKDEKKARELDDALSASNSKLLNLKGRQSNNAKSVQSRINDSMDALLMMRVYFGWHHIRKIDHMRTDMEKKIDYKRKKLQSIQVLFKDFSAQLEQGLTDDGGDTSARREVGPRKTKGSSKTGTSSLPDINQQPAVA